MAVDVVMTDQISSDSIYSKGLVQGWGVSALLHLGLVCAVMVSVPRLTLVPEPEPFTWEVALAEQSQELSQPDMAAQTPQPSQPLQPQASPPVENPHETMLARVVPQQHRQVLQPVLEPARSVERQEAKQETNKAEVREPQQVVKEAAKEVPPVPESAATAQPYIDPAPAATKPILEPHVEPSATRQAVEQHREPAAMASTPSPVGAEPTSMPPSPVHQPEPVVAPSASTPHEQPPLIASVSATRASAKADYKWLGDSLHRRVKELQKYPSAGRLNGWEGRVVVKAVIRADGQLAGVSVHKSSGYEALDQAAMEAVQLACPLHLNQTIAVPEVAFYVPVSYSLHN